MPVDIAALAKANPRLIIFHRDMDSRDPVANPDEFRNMRKYLGLSQKELARRAMVGEHIVEGAESGKQIPIEALR
jgi:DNA-binding transcriptional regulator YiaG